MSNESISKAELDALQGLIAGDEASASTQDDPTQSSEPVAPQPAASPVFPAVNGGGPKPSVTSNHALNMLRDVTMEVTVVLGHTKRKIGEILEMAPGSVLELDRLAGEAVDLVINNKRFAKGEVVVIGENFGIRITEIIKNGEGGAE